MTEHSDLIKKAGATRLRRRHALCIAAIFLASAVLFTFIGVAFVSKTEGNFQREIVNDDYDALTEPLSRGGEILQEIRVTGRLYGVRLLPADAGSGVSGAVAVEVIHEKSGETAARAEVTMAEADDGFFQLFLFDRGIDAPAETAYVLRITGLSDAGSGGAALYKSAGAAADYRNEDGKTPYPLSGLRLTENGRPQEGMLALQFITEYAGSFLYAPYILFSIFLTVFFIALYLLVFVFRAGLHTLFLVSGLALGIVFLFVIPNRTAPDEYLHIATAYRYANRLLGVPDGGEELTVRAGDEMYLVNYDFSASDVFAYQRVAEGLFSKDPGGGMRSVPARFNLGGYWPVYLPQTAGVLLARAVGAGNAGLLALGRFMNLLFYCLTVFFAIKRIPRFKKLLFSAALLPMSLQLAASFSYDTFVIALCFLFFSECIRLSEHREPVGWKEMLPLALLAALMAPAKAVYLPVAALVFLIPRGRFKKRAGLLLGAVVFAAVCSWAAFNLGSMQMVFAYRGEPLALPPAVSAVSVPAAAGTVLTEAAPEPAPEEPLYDVNENNDAKQHFSVNYILRHIPQTLLLLAESFWALTPLWLQGLIGGRLGEIIAINIEVSWMVTAGLLLLLLLSALPDREDRRPLGRNRRLLLGFTALSVLLLLLAASLSWTPINYGTLFGMQGRYLLPVLPLMLLAFRGKNLRFRGLSGGAILFFQPVLTALAVLQAFTVVIGR